ncbi:MAG TPA: hypothetical protein VGZ23_07910 [bacterium]|nr:hypothetical protein [bacterium]
MGSNGSSNGLPDPSSEGLDAGALRQDRDYINIATRSLPAGLVRRVLEAMDERRRGRRAAPARGTGLPDMSAAEMQREIAWRLDTLPPEDAAAIARLVRRLVPHGGQKSPARDDAAQEA